MPLYGKTAPKKPASKKTSQERADDALVSMFPHYFEAKKADDPFVIQTAIANESEQDRLKREADEAEKRRIRNKKKREARERKQQDDAEAVGKAQQQQEAEVKKQKRENAGKKEPDPLVAAVAAEPAAGPRFWLSGPSKVEASQQQQQQQRLKREADLFFGPRATTSAIRQKPVSAEPASASVFGPRKSGTWVQVADETKPKMKEKPASPSVFGPRKSGTWVQVVGETEVNVKEPIAAPNVKEESTSASVFGPRRPGTIPTGASASAPPLETPKEAAAFGVVGPTGAGTTPLAASKATAPLADPPAGAGRDALTSETRTRGEAEFTLEEKRAVIGD